MEIQSFKPKDKKNTYFCTFFLELRVQNLWIKIEKTFFSFLKLGFLGTLKQL